MSFQIVVITHENGVAAFKRHEKFWKSFGAPILVVTHEGDCSKYEHETVRIGKAQRAGTNSIYRLNKLFSILSKRSWNHCIIYEYDSFSLVPEIPGNPGLYGIVFENKESPKFMSPRYANPPWCFDRNTFLRLHLKSQEYPNLFECGEADRWISALAFLAGVPVFDYSPCGFSRGTISSADIPDLMKSVKEQKAIHFHGIKQDWVLRAIEQFYDESKVALCPERK